MKKYLLIPILTIIFAMPAFSAFPSGDMNNTHIEGNTISSNMPSQNTHKQRKKTNSENNLNNKNTLGDSTSSDNRKPRYPHAKSVQETQKDPKNEYKTARANNKLGPTNIQNKADNKTRSKHNSHSKHRVNDQDTQKKGEDENDNLKNIAQPAPANIQNNLRMPDGESSRLNREMMLNGPQGGIQNNQPRGIGSASY